MKRRKITDAERNMIAVLAECREAIAEKPQNEERLDRCLGFLDLYGDLSEIEDKETRAKLSKDRSYFREVVVSLVGEYSNEAGWIEMNR